MKLIHAVSLAVSLARAASAAAAQLEPAYAAPPPGYYGDYGPPLRYLQVLSGHGSPGIAPSRSRNRTDLLPR
jgi:hypothetical protein